MNPWPMVALGEVCRVVSGSTPKTGIAAYWGGDVAWATPRDLSRLASMYIDETERTISRAGLDSCAASILQPGSVLLSSRAPIGHVAVNRVPMATNQGFKSLVPQDGKVEPRYLFYWLKANRTSSRQGVTAPRSRNFPNRRSSSWRSRSRGSTSSGASLTRWTGPTPWGRSVVKPLLTSTISPRRCSVTCSAVPKTAANDTRREHWEICLPESRVGGT